MVTRKDLSPGYQSQQTAHSVADFGYLYPEQHKEWFENSCSIICVSVGDEEELLQMHEKISKLTNVALFQEPDLNDEYTSFCFYGDYNLRKIISALPLLGKQKYTYSQVIQDMINTQQTETQNVLEHGMSVNRYFKDLMSHLKDGTELKYEWKLPSWVTEHKNFILENLHDESDVNEYQIMHDCGKPYCLEIDEEGKRHYPNHAAMSAKVYSSLSNNKIVKDLIEKDMVFHTIKSDQVDDFVKENDIKTVITLLITALCEVHSNCAMFGGIDSTSFKIKYKQIDKRGKQILSSILVVS